MYHFPNQPLYQHHTYEQDYSLYCESKNQAPVVTENNEIFAINTEPSMQTNNTNVNKPYIPSAPVIKKITKQTNVDTSSFSIEERLVAAVWVHERKRSKSSMSQIKNEFRQRFGRDPPAKNTLLVWEKKLFSSGSVHDAPRSGRPSNRIRYVDEVRASIRSAPALSLRARALALRISRVTLHTIMKDLANNKETAKVLTKQRTMRKGKKILGSKNKHVTEVLPCAGNPLQPPT